MQQWGRFFDGESGQRLDVGLHLDKAAETLRLSHPDLPHGAQYWPLGAIRALRDQAISDQLVLSLFDDGALDSDLITTARLTVFDPKLIMELKVRCVHLDRRDMKPGTGRKMLIRGGGAIAAILLMIFVIIPAMANTLAGFIPVEREIAYGKSVVRQMERIFGGKTAGGLICRDEDGVAALEEMKTRLLEATGTIYDLDIVVFDHGMVNAFAAPGGQIVLLRGLIEKAEHPDEVAAVLAHEIGHVEARDVTRNALRVAGSAGLFSMVLGDISGGSAMILVAEAMLNASYTREAEGEADRYAQEMLRAANVNIRAMADFFDDLAVLEGRGPDLPNYLRSHPETGERAEAARNAARDQFGTRAVLSDTSWQALRKICAKS